MTFSMIRRIYDRLHPPRQLNCPKRLWSEILLELKNDGEGRRESGAFLLGYSEDGRRFVRDFITYKAVDPNALQGIIVFDGSKMDQVWDLCTRQGLQVVADVHTHPGGYGQSAVDQANPMIPQKGHLAMIVPNFADRFYGPSRIGLYEYRGRQGWLDHSPAGARFMRLEWLA